MKVLTEIRDRTFVITINRAQKRNCVDGETAALLSAAWKRFRDDEELYVAGDSGRQEKQTEENPGSHHPLRTARCGRRRPGPTSARRTSQ